MIRIPTVIVALCVGQMLAALAGLLALVLAHVWPLIVFLPLIAGISGFISARYSQEQAMVPGFAVGLIGLAVHVGLGLGGGVPSLAGLLIQIAPCELLAAIAGGLIGSIKWKQQGQRLLTRSDLQTLA
jgi:hypothetical protein